MFCVIVPSDLSEFIAASEQAYNELLERKFDDLDLLILYIRQATLGRLLKMKYRVVSL